MKILEYEVPVWNIEKTSGQATSQRIILENGYLRCLTDMGLASRAEVMPSGGKGAQAVRVQIELLDETKGPVIDATLRDLYNARTA